MPESLFNKVAQVFSGRFCEISKNTTFLQRTPLVAAFARCNIGMVEIMLLKNKSLCVYVTRITK